MKIALAVIVGVIVGLYVGTQTERVTQARHVADITGASYWQVLAPSSRPWIKILTWRPK